MRNVKVVFEISYSQEKSAKFLGSNKPDFVFQGEYDKADDESFSSLCDLEYKVEKFVESMRSLGCQVVGLRKEISSVGL